MGKEKKEEDKQERRFDPELLKEGLRCDLDQYDRLRRCSAKEDMTEWNRWRKEGDPNNDILLEGARLPRAYLKGVFLNTGLNSGFSGEVHLENAKLHGANLEDADLSDANLQGAKFIGAHLEGADFSYANLENADFRRAIVDGSTVIWRCEVDCYCKEKDGKEHFGTDFNGVGLDRMRVDPGTKQLLEYNIRRMNWEGWYKKGPWWVKFLKKSFIRPFWWMSDYGRSTGWIIAWFFGLAIAFAFVYWLWPGCLIVRGEVGYIRGFVHAFYFSVVTMTTLGFGDIAANPDSWGGQVLLMFQVILGYVLLGALVTRFAVLFTAGGPAGEFAKQKKKVDSVSGDNGIRGQGSTE